MGDGGQHGYSTTASALLQQELASLLATAFPGGGGVSEGGAAIADEAARVAALSAVHRMIIQPHAALHLRRSSFRICQALHQLLFDKSYAVRQAAVVAYGAWGAVAAAFPASSSSRAATGMTGGSAEHFMAWALPQLSNASLDNDAAVIAFTGLKEFFSIGEPGALERFASTIFRACQSLLEDEGTSMTFLRPLLGVLVVLGFRFSWCVQPHFADMVDLLLGWALESEVSEVDCRVITDSFVQFQNLWVESLPFSTKLLKKFLGDMEVLVQDATPATTQRLHRLLSLASCFVAVLQAVTAGVVESGKEEVMIAPALEMLPRLISCLKSVGRKYDDYNWTVVACQCVTLFADFLKEKFADYYSSAFQVVFQSLELEMSADGSQYSNKIEFVNASAGGALPVQHVHTLLLVNLQLLSPQGHALSVSAVQDLLKWDALLPSLRLHPVRGISTVVVTTYWFLLQHGSEVVALEARRCLKEELIGLKRHLLEMLPKDDGNQSARTISDAEAAALFKFDLSTLIGSTCVKTSVAGKPESEMSSPFHPERQLMRARDLQRFILDKLSPFKDPLQWYPSLQVAVLQAFCRICSVIVSISVSKEQSAENNFDLVAITLLSEGSAVIIPSLEPYASLPLILAGLHWINQLCEEVFVRREHSQSMGVKATEKHLKSSDVCAGPGLNDNFLCTLLRAASHKEPTVRGGVAVVLEQLLHAELVAPTQLQAVAVVALEQLGDPDPQLQAAFRRVLTAFAPAAIWLRGWISCSTKTVGQAYWKQLYPGNQSRQHLRPLQLVTLLNYISQRWQSLPQSWLQRFVHNCPATSISGATSEEEERIVKAEYPTLDSNVVEHRDDHAGGGTEILENACCSNDLAAGWRAIQIGARHFVTVRLRTHLGGPTQTFAVLERMLLDAAQLFQSNTGQRENLGTVGSSGVQLLPMRLLLEFMESLEKNIYNAYEGSVVLSNAPVASAPFFRANKKVCAEWFVRIREALMNLSVAIQCHAGTYHHASLRLQDLTLMASSSLRESARSQSSDAQPSLKAKVQQDVYGALRHASLALCRAHEVDILPGLQAWTKATFGALLVEDSHLLHKTTGPLSWMTGLFFQAQGQYEKAAAHYNLLLHSEEALGAMGAEGVQFTIARTIESYVALNDWEALDSWLHDLHLLRARHAGKAYSGALTTAGNDINAIHALARFDAGDVSGAWGYLDLTPQSSNELTADPRQALQRSDQMLLQAMLRQGNSKEVVRDVGTAKAMLEGGLAVAALDSLSDSAPVIIQLECIRAFEAATGSLDEHDDIAGAQLPSSLRVSALPQVLRAPLDVHQHHCQLWLKLLRVYRTVLPNSPQTYQLHQQLVRLARKQFNFKLAHRLLLKNPGEEAFKYGKTSAEAMQRELKYEGILLNYAEESYVDAIVELWDFVRCFISGSPSAELTESGDMLRAKACLKLSSWLQQRPLPVSAFNLLTRLSLDKVECHSSEASITAEELVSRGEEGSESEKALSIMQEIIGAGIKAATLLCPHMAKAWFSYASWCYDHAKAFLKGSSSVLKPVVFPKLLEPEVDGSESRLTSDTILTIISDAIYNQVSSKGEEEAANNGRLASFIKNNMEKIAALDPLVQHLVVVMQDAAGSAGVDDSGAESPAALLSTQLHQELQAVKLFSDPVDLSALVKQLMDVWWDLRRKKVTLFGHAARGFLYYLSMSNRGQPNLDTVGKRSWSGSVKLTRADGVLSASLYVLRILLNYGVELGETLAQGLSSVPPSPWQALTAQLFARLSSHPEVKVREQLEALLTSLAHLSPWAIVYPTLVDVNACEGQPPEELQRILSCLIDLHPRLVKDVQVLIAELGCMTVLWDEQWLSTLQDLHGDVMRRTATLKDEAARVAENPTLTHAEKARINSTKYSAVMAPVVVALERRLMSTSRPAETPHELWFQEQFGAQLRTAITTFKAPPASSASLGDTWRALDAIASSLGDHQKKSATLLSDISPQLASLGSSEAPMPGLEVESSILKDSVQCESWNVGSTKEIIDHPGIVTIAAFDEEVAILATKTKPKKISMVGSDGERYTYLLKGREDLRLDARIMQLLHAVNGMLRADSTARQKKGLSVRHYSVTPISGRAGLIQWVSNLSSMYSVFKAWQQRVQAAQLSSNTGLENINPPALPRPSDLFYGKIIPALKEKGLRKVVSRRDWPQEVKRKVLVELMKETPRLLLHRELWCASAGLHTFNVKQERFCGSVAVMSMVGFILGLGDRHLDNILVDFCTGDVVHIDYNVCFDKGLRLKIPEIVPFRLTQTIQAALGLTGVEGRFRANCEVVFRALQNHKDLILMLLEVFIWDPLLEWMRGDGHDEATIGGEERKGMEVAVSLSLFASRVQEIRVPLQEHHDRLLTTLPAVSAALESWTAARERHEQALALSKQVEQKQLTAARTEAAAMALASDASNKLEMTRVAHEVQAHEFGHVKGQLADAALEMTKWVDQHGRVLNALRTGNASELKAIGQLSSSSEGLSLTSAVLSAGVPLTIVPEPAQIHCREVDREVMQFTNARHEAVLRASKILQGYSLALQRILPGNYVASSDGHVWAQILQVLVRKLSPDIIAVAKRQALDVAARARGDHDNIVRQKYEALQMQVEQLWKEARKLQVECAELEASIDVEAEGKAKDRLLTIFSRHLLLKGKSKREDDVVSNAMNQSKVEGGKERDMGVSLEAEDKRAKVIFVLQAAIATLWNEISERLGAITAEGGFFPTAADSALDVWKWCLPELRKQVERWVLVSELLTEFQRLGCFLTDGLTPIAEWARTCQACMAGIEDLGNQLGGLVLPEAMKACLSRDPAVLEACAALSRVRLSIDAALEQVAVIEAQRSSLSDLEKSYPERVHQISKRQAELEDTAARNREHLSWEEAEELASEQEACLGVLEELHRAWAQRGSQASAIARSELNIQATLVATEQRFDSLVALDPDGDLHRMRGKVLLAAFARPFSGLEPLDRLLTSFADEAAEVDETSVTQTEVLTAGYPRFKSVWKSSDMNYRKMFFVWKIRIMDTLLSCCVNDASSSEDLNTGLDQILSYQKKRLDTQLQHFLDQYLKGRLGPVILSCLSKQKQALVPSSTEGKDLSHQMRKEEEALKRALRLILEYCDAHESVWSTNSTVSFLKSRVDDLMQGLRKAHMEAAQLGWVHDTSLARTIPQNQLLGFPNAIFGENNEASVPWWSRQKLLEGLKSSISAIMSANEGLQAVEVAASSAEEQLDRAMAWACGGPSNSNIVTGGGNRGVGVPPEFHEHLRRRRQLLWAEQEQATAVMRLCAALLEFESSRGCYNLNFNVDDSVPSPGRDDRHWQKSYQDLIAKLEATFVSFTSSELQWQEAKENAEAVVSHLRKATEEHRSTSRDVEATLRELQMANNDFVNITVQAAAAISNFCLVIQGHSALTVESGAMIEEVLAVTDGAEGVHDVHGLAQEAFVEHKQLMVDLNKINQVLLPVEPVLASAANGFRLEAATTARGQNYGQALPHSLSESVREVVPTVTSTVPEVINHVKRLHISLTKLAHTASSDAGVLQKALEGVGGSQEARSQEVAEAVASKLLISGRESPKRQAGKFIEEDVDDTATGLFSQSDELYQRGDEDEFLSRPDSLLAHESFHSNERGASSNQVESSQGLTGDGGTSEASGFERNSHLSGKVSQLRGKANPSLIAENGKTTPNAIPSPEQEHRSHWENSIVLEKAEKGTDTQSGLDAQKESPENLKSGRYTGRAQLTIAGTASGRQMDRKIGFGMDHTKQQHSSNIKGGYAMVNTDLPKQNVKEKNAYAVSVLKRVRTKLEGRDVNGSRQFSVSEHVDYLLKQAISLDNLCNMYEGWTPWI